MVLISVYDTVDGPKLRALYKKLNCSKFEALGVLNFLWLWGLKNADKDGMVLNADKKDVERYLQGVGAGCTIDSERIVDALISTGWIDTDDKGLHIHDWSQWQRKKDSTPEVSPNVTEMQTEMSIPEIEKKPGKYTSGFESFWKEYPRKVDKGMAYKTYQARRNDGFSDEELLEACIAYAKKCKEQHTEAMYIKHPKTFLGPSLPFTDFLPKDGEKIKKNDYELDDNPFSKYIDSE
ncbi:MAG: hypothetical protein LUE27_06705 [Clostridia bacterium]|nr:hypothetical protein [Clostridia bacterium]